MCHAHRGFELRTADQGLERAKKEALIRGDWAEISRLAKGRSRT